MVSLDVLDLVYKNDSSLLRKGGYYKGADPPGLHVDLDQGEYFLIKEGSGKWLRRHWFPALRNFSFDYKFSGALIASNNHFIRDDGGLSQFLFYFFQDDPKVLFVL